uniref:Uncharacterized protein n=1 Tax=Timema douglasi TaxID=61478 RepID=A0A7R8ZAK9_TIMDO|nr:unnamed protein product [Timema douglasi]
MAREVKEGFGNQTNLCRDQGLNSELPAQESGILPLDSQVISYTIKRHLQQMESQRKQQPHLVWFGSNWELGFWILNSFTK